MSVEFIDTNVLVYAHDGGAGNKHEKSVALNRRLIEEGSGALSTQVLIEFYSAALKKLKMTSRETEQVLADLAGWKIHRPSLEDLIRSAHLQRRYQISWWDALVVNSAMEVGARILWTEDLSDGQRYGHVTVRNPYL